MAKALKLSSNGTAEAPKVWFGPGRRGVLDAAASRVLEIVVSLAILILGAPLWLLLVILVRRDGGPAFFSQTRLGKGGRPFRFVKFRTMVNGNDHSAHRTYVVRLINGNDARYRARNGDLVAKIAGDRRITRLGRMLRKVGLDEVPQMLHVLAGDMSLVGPRPPIPYEVEAYQDWHWARLRGRPGVTGLWQVSGRSRVGFDDQVLLDVYYLANRSFWMDLRIILKTVPVMLTGKGGF